MLLGFKQRFADAVESGRKTHTIRAYRVNPPKVGEICHCYANPRQKSMRLLGRWKCSKVETIMIRRDFTVFISPRLIVPAHGLNAPWGYGFRPLDKGEREALAVADGFASFGDMMQFWRGRLPFIGNIIHWRYERVQKAAVAAGGEIER